MSPHKRKMLLFCCAIAIVLPTAFVIADYYGLFGVREETRTAFVDFTVRTVDAETGRGIDDVKVRCFQYTSNNACGQPPGRERGVVRISLLVEKHISSTLLFAKKVRYTPVNEDEIRVMFIHPDYRKPVERYRIPELLQNPEREFTIEMQPLNPAVERPAGTEQERS